MLSSFSSIKQGRASTPYHAGFDAACTTNDSLLISVPADSSNRSSFTRRSPGPRIVIGTVSVTGTRRGSTTTRASSPSAARFAEEVVAPVAVYRSTSVPSATFTVNTTGFDSPAARSKACCRGPSISASRESPVRASASAKLTSPVNRPVEVLLTFTGICTTSPSRRNRGMSGSTIRSFVATQVSTKVPLRRAASWARPLNCQVVSVSGSVNSIVTIPSEPDTSVGRKKAVSARLVRGGGGASRPGPLPESAGGRPSTPRRSAVSKSALAFFRSARVCISIGIAPAGAAGMASAIIIASGPRRIRENRMPPPPIAQPPRCGGPNGSRSSR